LKLLETEPFEIIGTGTLPEPVFDFLKNLNRNRNRNKSSGFQALRVILKNTKRELNHSPTIILNTLRNESVTRTHFYKRLAKRLNCFGGRTKKNRQSQIRSRSSAAKPTNDLGSRSRVELHTGRATLPASEADHRGSAARHSDGGRAEGAGKRAAVDRGEREENVAGRQSQRDENRAPRRGDIPPSVGQSDARAPESVLPFAEHAQRVPEGQTVAGRGGEEVVRGVSQEAVPVGASDGQGRQVFRRQFVQAAAVFLAGTTYALRTAG